MERNSKKLSIIVPVYNAEMYMEKCLNRLLEQSYSNIEIIIVNDCSKGNCEEIAEKYRQIDDRVKYIKHDENKGLFQARITGTSIATGEYIAFLDSDDYVSIDYYRTLMENIQENNSDIAMGHMVLEYDDGRQEEYNLFNAKHLNLEGEECLDEYFDQEGLSFDWHVIWNKIYKKEIWDKALKHYKKVTTHLLMTEDFAFSTVLFYYARKLTMVQNDCIFYCKHEKTSTSVNDLGISKFNKNIKDLKTSFGFVENFLKEENIYDKYKVKFNKWKCLYANQQKSYVQNSGMSEEEKEEANKKIEEFYPNAEKINNSEYFYSVVTKWDDSLEKIKLAICDKNTKCVSFDIFDTLVVRPFYAPPDLFFLLNKYFREYTNCESGIDFSKIRVNCENLAREQIKNEKRQEITFDEIYDTMEKEYDIDKNVIEKLKNKEIEYELRFCKRRNTGYELYSLALAMGKKVVFTSDMYLEKDVIQKILENNGYIDGGKLFLSSECKVTKESGDLFRYVLNELQINPEEIVHIGDNYNSDVIKPKELGINAKHLPKTMEVAQNEGKVNCLSKMFVQNMPFWRDNKCAIRYIGTRTMWAVAMNKYFDNPHRSFNIYTDFNADPYLIGYFAIGIYTFAISKWLLEESSKKGYKNMVFMARDGYLPMEAYRIMKKFYKDVPEAKYLYVSRKALLPVTIINKLDFYKISESIKVKKHTPNEILKYLKDCIKDNVDTEEVLRQNNIDANKKLESLMNFNKFMKVVIDNLYDEPKHMENLKKMKTYFERYYVGKSATFDVGYSARPELFLSKLCQKPIDTYFLNINEDEAYKHSDMGGFKIETFFSGKPSVTGTIYESVTSALAPSCIGYDINGNEVKPVFEKYNKTYQEEFIISIMQNAAIEFVNDMIDTFGEEIKELYYQKYYASLPIMAYINSSKDVDKAIFDAIYFEDDVRMKGSMKMTSDWNEELINKNQHTMGELIYGYGNNNNSNNMSSNNIEDNDIKISNELRNNDDKTENNDENDSSDNNAFVEEQEYVEYNNNPDLEKHSKLARCIYYFIFDRPTFKRKIREKLKSHKILFNIGKIIYKIGAKIKNIIYNIVRIAKGGKK